MSVRGILKREGSEYVLSSDDEESSIRGAAIWDGYLKHWRGMTLNGKLLPEKEYDSGRQILLLWPDETKPDSYVELYYNERLIKYRLSVLGHLAINVNGSVYNFSHLLNECEIMTEAEYLYRPALGKFAPSPFGLFDISNPEKPYLDKFGRQFMRTIHTVRITGIDTSRLELCLRNKIKEIHDAPVDPLRPDYWGGFHKFSNNCTTIIRDAFRASGFRDIRGIFPRDLFISAVWSFSKRTHQPGLSFLVYKREQLSVYEAPASRPSPIINPLNRIRRRILKLKGMDV